MGVVVGRIKCLRMDDENMKYYGAVAIEGDTVTLFTKNRGVINGVFKKASKGVVHYINIDTLNVNYINLSDIKSMQVVQRGENSLRFFR